MTEEDFECITRTIYKCKYCGRIETSKETMLEHIEYERGYIDEAKECVGKYYITSYFNDKVYMYIYGSHEKDGTILLDRFGIYVDDREISYASNSIDKYVLIPKNENHKVRTVDKEEFEKELKAEYDKRYKNCMEKLNAAVSHTQKINDE